MSSNRLKLTEQQRAALSTADVSIALSAGAGCGKTFVLTQRFLRRLRPGGPSDPLGGIVAITFTDRAAREMRDRIRTVCQQELQHSAPGEVDHWINIIRALDSARISTIHSFCSGLLRAHAVDAGLDPHFGLLEGSLGETFLRRVADELLRQKLSEQDEDAMQLVLQYGLERTVDLLRGLMSSRFQADLGAFEQHTPESLASEWLRHWHQEFIPRQLSELAESETARAIVELLNEHEPSHNVMAQRSATLLNLLPSLPDADDPEAVLAELRAAAQVQGGGGKSVWPDEDIYASVRDRLSALRKRLDRAIGDLEMDESHLQSSVQLALTAWKLLGPLEEHYELRKRESASLDFDDLLLKARNLLRDKPAVRKQAVAGIDFLMVDEFQDTDPVQAEIVRHLCGDRLTSGKLFVVGDAKQSIYRFRRADPDVFAGLRQEIPETGRLPLSVNFRSQPEILNFVNCLFAQTMADDYEPLEPFHAKQLSPKPAIEFLFASNTEVGENRPKENAADRRRREADWIARRIRQLLHDETPRIREKDTDTGEYELRPVRRGDIVILFRTLSHVALYEEALRRYGLKYYLVGSRAFFAQQEIYDLVNLCLYLIDPDDEVALAGLLRSPMFSLSDDTLFALAGGGKSLGAVLRNRVIPRHLGEAQQWQVRLAAEVLEELRGKKDRLGLAQLLTLAVERTGFDATLLGEFLGRRKVANLHKLIDKARQFDQSGLFTLPEFVERLQQAVLEESDEELAATQSEAGDVIRLMTVHQSKGLEFPVVVIADMDWTRGGGRSPAHFHPQLGPLLPLPAKFGETPRNPGQTMHRFFESQENKEETDRLFYVAATRAADYLILSAGLDENRRPRSPWLKLLSERFDLETGLPAVDPYLGKMTLGDIDPDKIPKIGVHHKPPDLSGLESSTSPERELPAAKFRGAVTAAEPAPLPELLAPLPQTSGRVFQVSVTKLEQVDAKLRGGTIPETDESSADDSGSERSKALTLGTAVHELLERIDYQSPVDLDALLETILAGEHGKQVPALRASAWKRAAAFLESPVCAEMQSARQCFREIDFLVKWPQPEAEPAVISGQIDCLLETPGKAWKILDYKTGRIADGDVQAALSHYELQLALYALAAREYLGRLPESAQLVLLGEEQTRRAALELNEHTLGEFSQRISRSIAHLRSPAGSNR